MRKHQGGVPVCLHQQIQGGAICGRHRTSTTFSSAELYQVGIAIGYSVNMFRALIVLSLAATVAAGSIQISRTVTLGDGISGSVVFDSGCTSKDKYGSNDCTFDWGSAIAGTVNGSLPNPLLKGSTFAGNLMLDNIIKFDFECPLCGGNCTLTVPIIKVRLELSFNSFARGHLKLDGLQHLTFSPSVSLRVTGPCTVVQKEYTFSLPDCPIPAKMIDQKFNLSLPVQDPLPVKITGSGPVTVKDHTGAVAASIDVQLTVS